MTKIKAISNPYKQEIKYETYKENTQEWDDMTSFRVQTEVSASPLPFSVGCLVLMARYRYLHLRV